MVEFKERLQAAMEHANVKREWLMARLGVSRVAIDKLLDGRSKSMKAEHCAITAQLLRVNHFWFATGIGKMLDADPGMPQPGAVPCVSEPQATYSTWPMQTVTLREYASLSERQQGHIEGQIRAMLEANKDKSNGKAAA